MPHVFAAYPDIRSGFSEAADGTMALTGGFDNRKNYLQTRGLSPERVVHARLCHGTDVAVVPAAAGGKIIDDVDGLITAEPNVALAMTAADCLLLSVYDPIQKIIGLAHAGRRGLAGGIIPKFFSTWLDHFSSQPKHIIVNISPSICPEHYPVAPEDAAAFSAWPAASQPRGSQVHLDLRTIARRQLLQAGLVPSNITFSDRCTFEDPQLYSYRRDHPPTPQLHVGYIVRGA